MLAANKKRKGKVLEDYVASKLKELDSYAYRRTDSGSGRLRKEDVFTRLPLFIECKNHKAKSIESWYTKAEMDTPTDRYTILVYKGDYQQGATVYMRMRELVGLLGGNKIKTGFPQMMMMELSDFISLLKEYGIHTKLQKDGD